MTGEAGRGWSRIRDKGKNRAGDRGESKVWGGKKNKVRHKDRDQDSASKGTGEKDRGAKSRRP